MLRWIVMVALLGFGCESGSRLRVDLVTDLPPGTAFDHVTTRAFRVGSDAPIAETTVEAEAASYLTGVRVAELAGLPSAVLEVEVALVRESRETATERVTVRLSSDSAVTVVIGCTSDISACPGAPRDAGVVPPDARADSGSDSGVEADLGGPSDAGPDASLCASAESSCGDGADDDCDGFVDCADSDCDGLACGAGGTCSSTLCEMPVDMGGCLANEARFRCANGIDDDCDGFTDCDDPSCALSPVCDGTDPR